MRKQSNAAPVQASDLRIAAYLRVSTDEQAESGLGLDAQTTRVQAMAVVQGWIEPALYVDAGVTGKIDIGDRPAGARLLADIEAGLIDAVIVSSLDRIGRKAIFILNFIDTTKDSVQLVSCKEKIDTATATGRFMVTILAGLAELERDTISDRTKAALEARGRSVGIKAGIPPYGYSYQGKDVLVCDKQAAIVRAVFTLRQAGLTYRAIADRVQSDQGVPIAFKTVQLILDREAVYRGCCRGESTEKWPVILA
jgi:site-specific DNA recombinase